MSRSRKKNPYQNFCCTSNRKNDRIENNRTRRHKEKQLLNSDFDPEEDVFPTANEISTPWDWGCDGWGRIDPDNLEEEFDIPRYKSMGK